MHGLDAPAKTIKAVNCVTIKNKKYYGSNTDWSGFKDVLLREVAKKKINETLFFQFLKKSYLGRSPSGPKSAQIRPKIGHFKNASNRC